MLFVSAFTPFACKKPLPDEAPPVQVAEDAAAPALALNTARRCGECHGPIHDEWAETGHAGSVRSAAYLAMKGTDTSCDKCHAPLAAVRVTNPMVAKEGVTCEVCHAIASAKADKAGGAFEMKLTQNVKYGPLCDAKNHYFHMMGCSPLHETSPFCASCHLLYRPVDKGAQLPVFTEYEEWEASTQGQTGIGCQWCHMPSRKTEIAIGGGPRPGTFHGSVTSKDLRKGTFKFTVAASNVGGKLHVSVTMLNDGAGHSVPTGAPERRLSLAVRVVSSAGAVVSEKERVYGRILVDGADKEVPFTKAVRVREDTRIKAGESRVETFDFDLAPPATGSLEAIVTLRDVAPAISTVLGIEAGKSVPVTSAKIDLAKGLPKTVEAAR